MITNHIQLFDCQSSGYNQLLNERNDENNAEAADQDDR